MLKFYMPQFGQIIASSIFILLLASCDEPQLIHSADGEFYVSHNNKDALYFKIDNQPVKLVQGEIKQLDLRAGKHTIKYTIGQKTEFIIYPGNQGELLILPGNIIILIVRFLKKLFITNYYL